MSAGRSRGAATNPELCGAARRTLALERLPPCTDSSAFGEAGEDFGGADFPAAAVFLPAGLAAAAVLRGALAAAVVFRAGGFFVPLTPFFPVGGLVLAMGALNLLGTGSSAPRPQFELAPDLRFEVLRNARLGHHRIADRKS